MDNPSKIEHVAVRTLWLCVALALRMYRVLCDATAFLPPRLNSVSTTLIQSVMFFTVFLQRLYRAVMAISPRCHEKCPRNNDCPLSWLIVRILTSICAEISHCVHFDMMQNTVTLAYS